MRLTRCHVPERLQPETDTVLPPAAAAHVSRVLRLRAGARLTLFDGSGGEYDATLVAIERGGAVRVGVGAHRDIERESPVELTLLQCVVRAERMDWIVQKATELGVAGIVPVASQHAVVRLEPAAAARRQQHWLAVAIGACEQCGRNRLPRVETVQPLAQACRNAVGSTSTRLVLDPSATRSLTAAAGSLPYRAGGFTLLVGPEGGLSDDELALAQQHGFSACSLGPRILRAETAPLAALSCLQTLLGDFSENLRSG
ncbi:MAG: 16S rRNA (uracil(1498)-N(3))-methyltransferase [Steroidobacteraceae bacterium]